MNRGLMHKAACEIWPATLLCGSLLLCVEAILAYVLPTFEAQVTESLRQMRFMQTFFSTMLGVNASGPLGPEVFFALAWVHPVVLALVWSHVLVSCTRMPAGEIERGTADVTFTLSVTRWDILRSETAVWLAASLAVLAMALVGNLVGSGYVADHERPEMARVLMVLANLLCMMLAVGGLAWLVSALSNRRGPAITAAFVVLLASFLLNYLSQIWSYAERLSFLGLLAYYRPVFILRDGTVPWQDMITLLVAAIALWTAAGIVLNRRDLCTV